MDPNALIIFDAEVIGANVTLGGSPLGDIQWGNGKVLRLDPTPLHPKGAVRFGDLPQWQQEQILAALRKQES